MSEFPDNIAAALADHFGEEFPGATVVQREIRPTDPNETIAVHVIDWRPLDWEIGNRDVSLSRYAIQVETMHRHADESEGRVAQARLAKNIRAMLYRDSGLRVRLTSLSENMLGTTERLKRWGVQLQRYHSNQLSGQFIFISVTELWVETEMA